MTCLYAHDFNMDDFVSLVLGIDWPEESLIMAFSPAQALFGRQDNNEEFFKETDQGRIFSAMGEFKWRRLETGIRAVYLGNPLPGLTMPDHSHLLHGLQPKLGQVLLWGVRTGLENEWLEQQVPHRFNYPLETAQYSRGRLALVIEHWLNQHELPQFSRYHSVAEISGEYHASR